jgi:beta-galactosidase
MNYDQVFRMVRFRQAKACRLFGWVFQIACGLGSVVLAGEDASAWLTGVESWGGRPALPALVNPVVKSPLQSVLSLRGEWEFVTQETAPLRHPGWQAFYAKPWAGARPIQVPGCWEAQGVGTPGMGDSWDCKWDHCAKPLRAIYKGDAWYRKTVTIPEAWRGQRIWLKVGGVRSQAWFWVNQTPVAWVDTYCGTYKYDITDLVQAGKQAVVVAEVNNVLPSRKGLFSSTHRFGGLYRDVELEATPDTRIDYAWVRSDFDQQVAEVHATVAYGEPVCSLTKPVLRVTLRTSDGQEAGNGVKEVTFEPQQKAAELICRIPLTRFQPWSPDAPALYLAELVLCDGDRPVHGLVERFGVRKFEVRGTRFFFNNQPFFVRGYGDDFVYPLTLVSPASREEHLKHFKMAREAGFVYVRLHTHCELPEYFEAADEAGVLVQPELPYYGDYPTEAFAFDPIRDLKELITHYRRHVSLATYCMGNEGSLGRPLGLQIYKLIKQLDPDRLVLHQDGTFNTRENSDFRNGPIDVWQPGSAVFDAPFVAHEYLNLSVKQDPRLAPKFTGAMLPPVPLETRDQWLTSAGLDRRWGDACQEAAHALQRHYQKQGLEAARMDPACHGYDFWTIVDVIVRQGNTYSAQGFLNPFWEPKSHGYTPADFRVFNGATVLLLKTEPGHRIAVSGERVRADFWISHYGERTLKQARLVWSLRTEKAVLAEGVCNGGEVELGSVRSLGQADMVIPELQKPVHAALEVTLADGAARNQWDFWLFPKRAPVRAEGIAVSKSLLPKVAPLYSGLAEAVTPGAATAQLLISSLGSPDVAPALAAGKRVILINRTTGKPNVSLGWWSMGEQVGTAFAKHPALGDFPHEGFLSPLAFRILKTGLKLPALAGFRPDEMIVVGEGLDSYFLYAGEARIKQGRALMTFGLDLLSGLPEANCLLDGLIRYAQSDAFHPQGEITMPAPPARLNGWQRTLKAGDVGYDLLPPTARQLDVARAMKGKNELIWETQPVPKTASEEKVFTITWEGGMGYFAEPPGTFALHVNDEKVLDIPALSEQSTVWFNADKTIGLKYERDPLRFEMGLLSLSMPSAKVTPGQPLRLKITASESNSRRWFGVCETSLEP